MPAKFTSRNFAAVTWGETLHFYSVLLRTPLYLAWLICKLPLISRFQPVKRYLWDRVFKYVVSPFNAVQMQKLLGTEDGIIRTWAKKNGVTPVVETVRVCFPEGERLMNIHWIGRQDAERVLVYLHGGGFTSPIQEYSLIFWRHVQLQVSQQNKDKSFSIAIPDYTLASESPFPTQLHQAVTALQHILDAGHTLPSDIIITGDSAGANLAYQLFQHMMNPLPSVPLVKLPNGPGSSPSKFAGLFFMSPWIDLRGETRAFETNAPYDIVSVPFYRRCGDVVLSGLQSKELEPWVLGTLDFTTIDGLVQHVLISGGGKECLIDSVMEFTERLRKGFSSSSNEKVELIYNENGTHDDMFFDFQAGVEPGAETKRIIEWVVERFSEDA